MNPPVVMILAAGRGERMRPLTDTCPKPLLDAGGQPLICWHLQHLAQAGFRQVVINHAHLGQMIEATLGSGHRWGLQIDYSPEQTALETAGGICRALPLLGDEPFLVLNGDVYTEWPVARAFSIARQMRTQSLLAWCVLIDNPAHNPAGDFVLANGQLGNHGTDRLTYSGIGLFSPALFKDCVPDQKAPLAPLLRAAADQQRAGAEYFGGRWVDVGTPKRLAELDQWLRDNGRLPAHAA